MRLLWRSWRAVFLYLSANFQPRLTNASDPVAVEHRALLRFMMLYSALFSAFGLASPFLPAFLAGRGLGPEEIGLVLGAATALRLVCGPIAGRLADRGRDGGAPVLGSP
jgi:MFS family permease